VAVGAATTDWPLTEAENVSVERTPAAKQAILVFPNTTRERRTCTSWEFVIVASLSIAESPIHRRRRWTLAVARIGDGNQR
jgi:hypothetical protein